MQNSCNSGEMLSTRQVYHGPSMQDCFINILMFVSSELRFYEGTAPKGVKKLTIRARFCIHHLGTQRGYIHGRSVEKGEAINKDANERER